MRINPQDGSDAVAYQPSTDGRATLRLGGPVPGNTRHVSGLTGTSGTLTGLTPNTTYLLAIRAYDAAGNASPWSTQISVTTLNVAVPDTVAATTAIPAVAPTVPLIPATVAATTAIATPLAGPFRVVTGIGGTSTTITGLTPNTQYRAQVRAVDAAGNRSGWSGSYTFTTLNIAAPATVAATTTVPTTAVGGAPPTLIAGVARPVINSGTVLLDVAATPPGAATITGYAWTITAGLGSLSNASTATPTYTAASSGTGTSTVRVTVTTSNGGSAFVDTTVGYGASITAAENQLTGTARATWDLADPNLGGASTLQGFCDGFTINKGGTASFKIAQSDTAGWTADVYRLGYYAGNGARLYANLSPNGTQLTNSQAQPSPGDADPDTTLLSADCGNWATTLTWTPPTWAPSGMYLLRLNRTGGGSSHVMFILRDDARAADLMLMPADATWNAYNAFGGMGSGQYMGNSLYYGTLVDQYNADCAHYVSYNRPVVNRGAVDTGRSYGAVEWSNFFTAEYPMVRFLERNGVDVKYYGCIDAAGDATGTHLLGDTAGHGAVKAAMFTGHNEYWSNVMRAGWERAKNRGVSVFSCAGNEVFWRLVGSSADSDGRPRTWECQKSTINGRGNTRPEWTGTWRDPDGAGKGGNNPELSFTGTIYTVNGPDLRSFAVPFAGGYSATPLWRNTTVAALTTGQTFTSPDQILGFEWDTYGSAGSSTTGNAFMGSPNPRAIFCSTVTYTIANQVLTDAGDVYGSGDVTHRLVVHPGGAGAMVFGTGTVNWALGCDPSNYPLIGQDNVSIPIQQATLNILTDMGAPPRSLMSGMTQPTPVDWFPDVPTSTVVGTTAIAAPTIIAGQSTTVTATTVAAAASVPSPTVRASITTAPATVAATTTVGSAVGRLFVQDFEQGSAGTTVTTGNSGGGTSTPWTNVYLGGGQTIVRYSTSSYRGALSGQYYTVLVTDAAYTDRLLGSSSDIPVYARMRMMASAMPDASGEPFARFIDSGGNVQAEARLTSTGALALYSGAGNLIGTSLATITGFAWADVGLSVKAFSASVGQIEMVIYNSAGTVGETITSSANLNTLRSGGANQLRVGQLRTDIMLYSVFLDDVAIATGSYPILPTATSTWALPSTVLVNTTVPAPTVSAGSSASVTAAVVSASTAIPAAGLRTASTVVPAVVAGSTAIATPTILRGATATPAVVAASTAVPNGSVQTTGNANVAAATVTAAAAVATPTVVTASGTNVNAATVGGTTTVGAATPAAGATALPAVVASTTVVPTPTVLVTSGSTPAPGTLAAQAAVAAVAVLTGSQVSPATVAGATAVPGPLVGLAVNATPITVTATAAVAGPGLRAGQTVQPGGIQLTVTIGAVRQLVGQVVTSVTTGSVTGATLTGQVVGQTLTASIT